MKLIPMSSDLKIPESINCIFLKKGKYIFKVYITRIKVSRKIIYLNLVDFIIPIRYEKSTKNSLFLTDDATYTRISMFFKKKSQVKVELLKYIQNMQI